MRLVDFFSLLVLIFAGAQASAQSNGIHSRIHHPYQSVRALGMGDAFTAVSNDYSAMFYNPAALARRDQLQINMSLDFAGSKTFSDLGQEFSKTNTSNSSDKFLEVSNLLANNYGKPFMLRTSLLHGIIVGEGWGLAVLPMEFTFEGKIHNQVAPSLNVRAYADTTLAYSYADNFRGDYMGKLSWGTTFKVVNRGFISKQISALDLAQNSNLLQKEDVTEGYTYDLDLGFLYTPALPGDGWWYMFKMARPTMGVVVRNLAETGFARSAGLINKQLSEYPEKLSRVLDLGLKFEYPSLWIFGGRGAIDIRDIGHGSFTLRRAFHLGFEFDWAVSSWWRGAYRIGVNQGYPTLGFSALFTVFNLDLATYSEEVGSIDQPKENRMYAVKLNIDI